MRRYLVAQEPRTRQSPTELLPSRPFEEGSLGHRFEGALEFGKYRGTMLKDVPFDYLCFLTQWSVVDGRMTDIVKDYLESQT